jgi:dihydropteroate synthase
MQKASTQSETASRAVRQRPLIMGVINVTPDSFSDGGRFLDADSAIEHGRELADSGADLLDVGGESTRPGSLPVTAAEQWSRIGRVVAELARGPLPVSVDTRTAEVARRALEHGATIINDVSAGADPGLLREVVRFGATVVLMHMQGEPRSMQNRPEYRDCAEEVALFLGAARARAVEAGVSPERVWIDPGIGFGKELEHNLELLRALPRLVATGAPVVVGTSRKSFISGCSPADPNRRLAGSLASLVPAWRAGVHVVRVHDAFETRQFFDVLEQVGG